MVRTFANVIICPSISWLTTSKAFMLMQTADPTTLRDALPNFRKSTHIFLPINDCRAPNLPQGGSHWSLLLVSILDGVAFHYDSLYPSNHQAAFNCCDKFQNLLGKPLRFVNLYDSPQQNNGSDCGIYVCVEMKELLKRLLKKGPQDKVSMTMRGLNIDAPRARKMMTGLIDEFRKEGRRSMSRSRSPSGSNRSPPRVGD